MMEGIKEALQYVVGLREPKVIEITGEQYCDKDLHRVYHNPKAKPIEMCTLTSLVEYLEKSIDSMQLKMIVHVVSPIQVMLYSQLDVDRIREYLVEVNAQIPSFRYGEYMNHENFLIALQSKFIANKNRAELLQFAGTVENGTIAQYGDDGVTQKATVKTGIASKNEMLVPNPVVLKPFRTFIEVEQPDSAFIFRMKQNERSGVECAIFEADGGAWKNEATQRIKDYLKNELIQFPQFTIIS